MPGTQPFFVGLYGLLRLQSLPEKLGGAGERLIEWEIDDAVFLESAGKDFTLEAIAVLKGVSSVTVQRGSMLLKDFLQGACI